MFAAPKREEIDHRTTKLIVGIIAIGMPCVTSYFSASKITSISASYYEGGWAQSFFVGFLFAIAAFLLSYNGMSKWEMRLSKVAAPAALLIALMPCACNGHPQIISGWHGISAAVLFLILAFFCYGFFQRARAKGHTRARVRAGIYAACGVAMVGAIVVLGIDSFSGGALSAKCARLTFYGEATGLVSFGISWLVASRVLPGLTRPDERFSLLREDNPA